MSGLRFATAWESVHWNNLIEGVGRRVPEAHDHPSAIKCMANTRSYDVLPRLGHVVGLGWLCVCAFFAGGIVIEDRNPADGYASRHWA